MTKSLELLQNCSSVAELRPLLQAVCKGFGAVSRLDILTATQVGKRQALCFLRMATAEQEERLMRELGVGRFGGDIVVIVDLLGKGTGEPSDYGALHPRGEVFKPTLPVASTASAGLTGRLPTKRFAKVSQRLLPGLTRSFGTV